MKRKHLRSAHRLALAILLLLGLGFTSLQDGLYAQTDLEVVSITHVDAPLVPGDVEEFHIVIRNNGPNPASGVAVAFDILDCNWYHANAFAPGPWTFLLNGTSFLTVPMGVGESVTLTMEAEIPSDASHTTSIAPIGPAWASVSFAGVDITSGNNEEVLNLSSRIEANLTIQKNLLTPQVAPGGTALYDITVCNAGPSDVAGVGVTDTPGANLVFGSVELSPGSNNLYIPAMQCRTVSATATVSQSAPVGANFGNTASIDISNLADGPGASEPPVIIVGGPGVDNSGVVRHALPTIDLEIVSLTLSGGGPVVPGTTQTFIVEVRNNGPSDAYGAILNMNLVDAAFVVDNGLIPVGWTATSSGGTWQHPGAWPAGATSVFSIDLRVLSDAHYQAGDPISPFWATIGSSNPESNTANNFDFISFDVQAQGSLTLDVQTLTSGVSPQGTAMYSVTICNSGPSDLGGLDVTLTPGPGLVAASLVSSLNPNNIYVAAGQCVDMIVTARVAAGAAIGSNVCLNAAVVAGSANAGAGATLAALHNAPSDQSCALVNHPLAPADVEIVSMTLQGAGPFVPGTVRTFQVQVRNNGPTDAYGAVLTTWLGAAATLESGNAPAGWASSPSSGGTWMRVAPMPSGQIETFLIDYRLHPDAHYIPSVFPIAFFYGNIAASNPDPNVGNNSNVIIFDSRADADLSITKTLFTEEVSMGGTALYEVTVCNNGPSDISGIAVNDVLGANLNGLVLSAAAGDLYIAAGQCIDVLVSAQVDLAAVPGDDFCNSANVDASGADGGSTTMAPVVNSPATGSVCGEVIDALPDADVEAVSLTHVTSPLIPGTTETFTFTVRNNGPAPAYGATVVFNLLDTEWAIDNNSPPAGWSFFGNGTFVRTTAMPAGATESFSIDLSIPANAFVVAKNDPIGPFSITIAASNPDPDITNNTLNEFNLVVENHADLSIVKDLINSEISPGETAIFNITVNNAGPSDVDEVGIVDVLNGNATFLHFEPFNIDNFYVPAGQSVSFLVTVRVNDNGCGTVENCAFVFSPGYNIDNNPANNGPACDEFEIYDDVDPVAAVCPPATIEVDNDPGICGAFIECEVVFTDNCDDDLLIELVKGIPCECDEEGEGEGEGGPCGNIFPVGMTQVIYKATDGNGNMAFCEFMVMVNDTEDPTIDCPRDIVININSNGIATVEEGYANIFQQGPCGVTLTYERPYGEDNCGGWLIYNTSGLGATNNCDITGFGGGCFFYDNWDITADGDGQVIFNQNNQTVTLLSANDGTNNAVSSMCITIQADGLLSFDWNYVSADVDGPSWDPFGYTIDGVFYQLSDNFGGPVQNGSVVNIPVQQGQVFCFSQTSVDGAFGPAVTVSSFFAFDDPLEPNPEYYQYGGTYTESFMIVDAAGNTEHCSFSITIEDAQFPTITCPNNFVVGTDPGVCYAQVMYTYPLGLDNCPDWFVTIIEGPQPGQNFAIGDTEVTYLITDNAGNGTTCTFKVRVVDTEDPTFYECAEDREIYTSTNGIGDCCSEVPRLTDEVVVGDNCATTDLPVIALFYDPDYVDVTPNCDGTAYNVKEHLESLGFQIVFADRLEDFPTWSAALSQSELLVIPALLGGGNFLADMPGSVSTLLNGFVLNNNGRVLVMAGGTGANEAVNVMNTLYGFSLTENCCYNNGSLSYLHPENSLYTAFQYGPSSIEHHFSTRTVEGMVWPDRAIYERVVGGVPQDGEASVAKFFKGSGELIYFGWSFRLGGPLCDDADTEFTQVFNRALLELAGEGMIITQSPEAFSTVCGDHGDEIEVVITAVDYSGNESSCTTILTLIDDENPIVFPPDPISLNCEDISETADPTVIILDWLAEAYATDNCDVEPMLTYDFDVTDIDICALAPYDITVTWTAVDDAGNSATGISTITINPDVVAPDLFVPAGIELDCYDISETSDPAAIIDAWLAEAYATDICDTDPVLTHSFDIGTLDICADQTYDITVTWTATDHCGNSTTASSTITVIPDVVAPDLFVPAAIELDCDDISETADPAAIIDAWLAEAYATDLCDTDPELSHSFTGTLLDICADAPYDITVTWTAVDHCGNSTTASSTITIYPDVVNPDLFVPAAIELDCDDISETADPAAIIDAWLAEAFATDNCDTDPELSHSFNGSLLDICEDEPYVITVTWTAVDHCGNSTTASSTITVNPDVVSPDLFVPAAIELDCEDISETADPAAIIDAWLAEAFATDNCDTDPELSHSFNGSLLDICEDEPYVITVTWTAVDHCGNSTTASSTITVYPDVVNPDLFVPAAIELDCYDISETTSPAAIIDAWLAEAYATDNCDTDPELSHSFDGSLLDICADEAYSITVTWTAVDHCGNSATASSTITVIPDVTAPDLFVPAAIELDCDDISETADPAAIIDAWLAEAYATDLCDTDPELSYSFNGTLLDICADAPYDITVTWTAVDHCGNSTTASSTITIYPDVIAPDLFLPDPITLDCGEISETADPAAIIAAWLGEAYAEDNCDTDPVLSYDFDFWLLDICADEAYDITVTWTAVDHCGNSTTGTSTITVIPDTEAPVITLPAQPLVLDCDDISETTDPTATILDWLAQAYATDVCDTDPELTYDFDFTELDVCVGGTLTVTWTAVDHCGNVSTASSTITVIPDLDAPIFIQCPSDLTFNNDVDKCGANVTWPIPTAFDECTAEVNVVQTAGPAQGSFLSVGVIYTIEYTATDACGNTAICTFDIEILDMQNPVAICQDVVVYLDPIDGEASITAADVDGGSYDNCDIVDWTISEDFFTCDNVGENNVTLTVTDAAGNSEVCVAEVSVVDNTAPTFTCPDPALVSGCDELVPDLVSLVTDAFDNCGVEYIYQNPVAGTDFGNQSGQSIIVTIFVGDVNGNVATCEVEVTIEDTVPPVFTNCPTEMHMIGNDPDQCSGKLNWSIPVATDNCELESITQIAGPPVGSIIPVCQVITITYEAEDASGNTSLCSFEVLVVDTQKPEFDADIVMPGDITVECDAIPAPFVLTNNDVNDNCTAPADLIIEFTETDTQDPNEFNCGHYNYTITRTWTVTDETCVFGGGGNQLIHVQIITVEDTTPPTAVCQNITVELDKFGQATITGADIDGGSFDNCAPAYTLDLEANPNTFDCSDLGPNQVTLTVTDPCGNSSTCIAIVTVVEGIAPCTPEFSVETECLNNATTLANGQFEELITVKSLAMQTWSVQSSTGLFAFNSPAPPSAPIGIGNAVFTMGNLDGIDNDGDGQTDEADEMIYYTLRAKFVECIGYTATLVNNLNQTGTISNKACYPTPIFVDLFDPFCLSTPPFPILVEDFYGAEGQIIAVEIDGVSIPAPFIFDALALGEGPHFIKVTFDAGDFTSYTIINGQVVAGSEAETLTNSGCQQMISAWVNVVETPDVVACNDLIQVSLEGTCVSEVTPDMILEGSYLCYDDYTVTINYPWNTTQFNPANQVDASHIGEELTVLLSHLISGNMCWATIVVEDKWKPEITCPDDIDILCVVDDDNLLIVGSPVVFDCSDYVLEYSNVFTQFDCDENDAISTSIVRTWIATDIYGNTNSCVQHINKLRGEISQVTWPADISYNCNNTPANFNPPTTGWPTIGGVNLTTDGTGACGLSVSFTDQIANVCPGEYKIIRTWLINDWCTEGTGGITNATHVQYIAIKDVAPSISFSGPVWQYDPVNDWYIISANNWVSQPHNSCFALGPLPLALIDGVCNQIVSLEISTPVGTTTNGGVLPWPGLGIGVHPITYVAEDECGNITSVTIYINVVDNIVPTTICDEITDVNLSGDGIAIVNATTFDDGTYDNCCLAYFEARRMDGDCDGNFDDFGPTVEFCCVDAGQPVMVVFRAYDCYGNFNDCMVSVNVNDKLPPITISCPGSATITCDNYLANYAAGLDGGDYSVLDGFGAPVFYDNCQLDVTHTVTVNINNCAQGTITRSWSATDGTNVPVTCTQTIFVNHVSDWVVEFPANVTVECTDGQLPDTGEPEIFFDECELIAVSYEDQTFTVVPDACYKIERTWTVINWCVYEQFGEDLYTELGFAEQNLNVDWDGDGDRDNRTFRDGYNSSGTPGTADGYITWKQIIKVDDNEDPIFTVPQIDGCIVDTDCDMDLVLPYPIITDECSPTFDVDITGDFGTFNNISGDVTIPDVGVGEYEVNYAVTDNCGNTSYETITVVVEDCKKPTPLCDNGLVVEIMQTQMVAVDAEAFDEGSFDNCGPIAHFSYSSDITNTTMIFDCDDVVVGQVSVQIWVTDIYGNQDYCETYIIVQDNMNFCNGVPIVIAGEIATEEEDAVEGVTVEMNGGLFSQVTGLDGQFDFSVIAGNDYTVTPMLDENASNGVTTFDMVLITRHVLNVDLLDSPYKIIAADANNSGTVTTLDLVAIRKVILHVEDNFPNNTSWRFVDEDYSFPNPQNPWTVAFPEVINYNNLTASDLAADFVAIKVGDVNGSAATSLDGQADQRTMMGDLLFHTKDMELKAGQVYSIPFFGNDQEVFGYQFTLELGEGIELIDVTEGVAKAENFGFALLKEGALTTSWNESDARILSSEEAIFTLVIKAKENTTLSNELSASSRYTAAEAYSSNGDLLNVQLTFGNEVAAGFELYQNIPNPFTGVTRIGFRLPEPAVASLTIMDASGKVVRVVKGEYGKGYNEVNLSDFGGVSGVLYYQLDTPTHSATRKMVILE